jgi:large subunit ribosomal protein L17
MRHRVAHRKLGRVATHRIALLRNLATALFERERISTTLMKAKELRPYAEKLITQAKREDDRLHARRLVLREIHDPTVLKKLFDDLGARFATRPGGYTRILRLGPRKGDGAEMAIVELIGSEYKPEKAEKGKKAAAAKAEKGGEKGEKAAKEKGEKAEKAPRQKGAGKGRGAQPGSTRRNTPRKVGSS